MGTETAFDVRREAAGHVRVEYAPETKISLELAEASVAAANTLAGGAYKLMVVFAGLKDVDTSARQYLANATGPSAVALVVLSPVDRIVANVFLGLSTTAAYQLKAFSSESDAAEWLATA